MLRPVVDNARRGERIVILRTGAETGGELLLFDAFLQPGAHVPASHVHPRQEERFTILSGKLRFRLGHQSLIAERGVSLTVPGGTPHWFGNIGDGVAQVRVEVRPAGTCGWASASDRPRWTRSAWTLKARWVVCLTTPSNCCVSGRTGGASSSPPARL